MYDPLVFTIDFLPPGPTIESLVTDARIEASGVFVGVGVAVVVAIGVGVAGNRIAGVGVAGIGVIASDGID